MLPSDILAVCGQDDISMDLLDKWVRQHNARMSKLKGIASDVQNHALLITAVIEQLDKITIPEPLPPQSVRNALGGLRRPGFLGQSSNRARPQREAKESKFDASSSGNAVKRNGGQPAPWPLPPKSGRIGEGSTALGEEAPGQTETLDGDTACAQSLLSELTPAAELNSGETASKTTPGLNDRTVSEVAPDSGCPSGDEELERVVVVSHVVQAPEVPDCPEDGMKSLNAPVADADGNSRTVGDGKEVHNRPSRDAREDVPRKVTPGGAMQELPAAPRTVASATAGEAGEQAASMEESAGLHRSRGKEQGERQGLVTRGLDGLDAKGRVPTGTTGNDNDRGKSKEAPMPCGTWVSIAIALVGIGGAYMMWLLQPDVATRSWEPPPEVLARV